MFKEEIKKRSKQLAIGVIRMTECLPRGRIADIISRQIIRSSTSVAANYRAACRARSRMEFIAKMGIVEEESDETSFWLEMMIDTNLVKKESVADLLSETNQITAIVVSSVITARKSAS
jgi:four helix bundle protein